MAVWAPFVVAAANVIDAYRNPRVSTVPVTVVTPEVFTS
jgi:hypothetical protein